MLLRPQFEVQHAMSIVRISLFTLALAGMAACGSSDVPNDSPSSAVKVSLLEYSTKSDEARRHVQEGERLDDTGFPLRANEEFKRAVAADSSFGYAYLRVAQNAYSGDEYATNVRRAGAHLATASPVEALLIQAEQTNDHNDLAGALGLLKKAADLAPTNARVWMVLGREYFLMVKPTEARAVFEKVVAMDTTYARPMYWLVSSYLFQEPKDIAKAEQFALRGQRLWPREPISYLWLGNVRRAQGRLEDAIAAYSREIELAPTDMSAFDNRGNTNAFAGHDDAARADFDAALRVAKPAERAGVGMDRGYLRAYQGDFDGALKDLADFRSAIAGMHTPSPEQDKVNLLYAELTIALLHHRFPLVDSAVVQFNAINRALAKASNSDGYVKWAEGFANHLDGLLAAHHGDFATARARLADVQRVRAADKDDPTTAAQIHGLAGLIALLQKDYPTASRELALADPTNTQMHFLYWRALAAEGQGQTTEEKDLLRRIATWNFSSAEYAAVRYDAIQKLNSLK
jgi:tetratricopeptide (TPR) repeat protein